MTKRPTQVAQGIHEAVEAATAAVDLKAACKRLSASQHWDAAKVAQAEQGYRKTLNEFALAHEGLGCVANVSNDVAVLWREHCADGAKYAEDMLTIVNSLLFFRGKSIDDKIPGLCD